MKVPKVSLYLRVTQPEGRRVYLKPVYSNRRLQPLHALLDKKPEHFPSGIYYLRYIPKKGKPPCWERIGSDAELVPDILQRRKHALEGAALGLPVAAAIVQSQSQTPTPPKPTPLPGQLSLHDTIKEYLDEKKAHKRKRSAQAYANAVNQFGAVCKKATLQQIDRQDLLTYATFLRGKGNKPRTVFNLVSHVHIFLHHYGLPSLLSKKKGDLPKYTEKSVRKYGDSIMARLFEHATLDESDLLSFFMETGAREQETEYACWPDVDFEGKTYSIQEHLDLGFSPKDSEEGTVRISGALVEVLRARRKRYPTGRLIFPGPRGKPNGHLLRIIKELGLRARVNCGYCVNKKGLSCATHPVCHEIILHKLRKTYASKLSRNGVPVRTIQRWLRHSDLETTLAYLADEDDDGLSEMVDRAFPSRTLETRR
jgi:integrase/recombinase XerD